jgi:hypothetical protein
MFLKTLFVGPDKPKTPNMKPPGPSDSEIQRQAADAQRRAALAKGRSSTVLTGGGLGNVG